MEKELKELLDAAEKLKNVQALKLQQALKDVENLEDKKMKEYIKKSLSLAQKDELNIDEFLNKIKEFQNAC